MIIKRKCFGLFGNLFNKSNPKSITPPLQNNVNWDGTIDVSPIEYRKMAEEGYYPSLVFVGLKMKDDNDQEGLRKDWDTMMTNLNNRGLFVGNNYKLMAARRLSDNIKGNNGLTCYYVKFTPDTKINSGTRLVYGDKIKWADDFQNNYKSWYKSGRI